MSARAWLTAVLLSHAAAASAQTPQPSPEPTGQTVVTGSRTEERDEDAVVPIEVISRREIEASGARDLGELLETHPGIELVYSFRGVGVRLQGLDPEYVLILLDGERIAGRVGNTQDLARFSLRDIERVEIVKGPASVLYGSDAIAGVINLITRPPRRDLEGEARASYGTRGELDLRGTAGARREGFSLQLGGGLRGADAYDLDPADVATSGSAFNNWDVGGLLEWKPSDALEFQLRSDYARNDNAGIDGSATGAVFDRHGRTETFGTALRSRWRPAVDSTLTARGRFSLFRDQLLQDQRLSRDLDLYQEAREYLWEAGVQFDQRVAERHLLTAAVEGLSETVASPRIGAGEGRRMRLGLLAQDEWQPFTERTLTATFGARVDLDTQFGRNFSPRVAVRLQPIQPLILRASYGWGFRAPSFQELYLLFENPGVGYVVEGNPALRPETSQGLNVSADARLGEALVLSSSLYFTEIRGLIAVVTRVSPDPDLPTRFGYENVDRARTWGGELSAKLRLASGVWLDAGYALTDARNVTTGAELEGRARHRGTVELSGRYRPWRLDGMVRAAVVGTRPFYPTGNPADGMETAPPYASVDARVAYTPWPFLTVFVTGSNLLDAGDATQLTIPPRSVHAGVIGRY